MVDDDRATALRRARAWAMVIGVALTALAVSTPFRTAYHVPGLHPVIDTTVGLVAILLAYLLYGRARVRNDPSAWLLAFAMAVAGLTNLGLSSIPVATGIGNERYVAWSPAFGRLAVAGLLCAAAFVRPRARTVPNGAMLLGGAAALTATVALLVAAIVTGLPDPVDPLLSPNESGRALVAGHPLSLTVQSIDLVLYAVAAIRFGSISRRRADELLGWLSAAAMLAAFGRLNYLLFPSLYTGWIYTGDALRLGSFLLLLEGAAREIEGYWESLARSAVAEERRRVAREVHDGLAQELSFLAVQARLLAGRGDETAERIAGAAERALEESRLAIDALARRESPDPHALLARTAEDIGHRLGSVVTSEVDRTVPLDADTGLELARVVREAVTNACRHGGAGTVHVDLLRHDGSTVLRITDNGSGFDLESRSGRGFGLVSMEERAEALGGRFEVSSRPGVGTTVTLWLR